jgi:shikimate kinase
LGKQPDRALLRASRSGRSERGAEHGCHTEPQRRAKEGGSEHARSAWELVVRHNPLDPRRRRRNVPGDQEHRAAQNQYEKQHQQSTVDRGHRFQRCPSGSGEGLASRPDRRFISQCVAQFQRPVKRPDDHSPKTRRPMATPIEPVPDLPVDRTIVLIGMMGAGKSAVGRRLASALGLPFEDADAAIEAAAGATISDIFAEIGEAAFREKERQVIARLLSGEKQVLALGGGAFMDPETRRLVRARALSIWLSAGLDALVRRTARRGTRPLLEQADPAATLAQLLEQRGPVYAQADIVVDSGTGPLNAVVARVLDALARHLDGAAK